MRPLRFVSRHPGTLLAIVATAFAGWVWYDVFRPKPRALPTEIAVEDSGNGAILPKRMLPLPFPFEEQKVKSNARITAEALPKLKLGMTRTEIEGLVGRPAPQDVHPATVTDGRVTYLASYEADLGPPPTVRPIRPTRPVVTPPASRMLVTLEFDASKPGHPLIEIHYPDPLF